jgi:thiol-disulfide isomerase/thioredoxin
MKKIFLVSAIAVSILFAACSSNRYVIEGIISGDAEGKTVHLCTGDGPFDIKPFDSTVIRDGRFKFSGELPHLERYVIRIFPTDERGFGSRGFIFRPVVPLFVSAGKITVEAHIDSIPVESLGVLKGFYYDFSKIKVTGAPAMMKYVEYTKERNAMLKKEIDANQAYMYWYRTHDNSKLVDLDNITISKRNTVEYAINYIGQNKTDFVSAFALLDNLGNMTVSDIDKATGLLSQVVKDSPAGKKAIEAAMEIRKTAVGSTFADLMLQDRDGNEVRLSGHAGKGRYVLLEFWASWCHPCRADIPHLKKAYELYHQDGFDIISISIDRVREDWLKAVDEEQMSWLQVFDMKAFDGETQKLYNFMGIPFCVFVDPDGIIIDRNMRGHYLVKKLSELYGNKFD